MPNTAMPSGSPAWSPPGPPQRTGRDPTDQAVANQPPPPPLTHCTLDGEIMHLVCHEAKWIIFHPGGQPSRLQDGGYGKFTSTRHKLLDKVQSEGYCRSTLLR